MIFFHAKKSLNKQLNNLKNKYGLSDEKYGGCNPQLKIIKNLFDLKNYNEVNKEL